MQEHKFYKDRYKNNFWEWTREIDYLLRKKHENFRGKINKSKNNLITKKVIKSFLGKYYIQ